MCRRDHGWLVSGYGLNFIGGALAAKAQPLHDFTKLSMPLSMLLTSQLGL